MLIKKIKRTKEKFHYYHILLWDKIIENIKEGYFEIYGGGDYIKINAWDEIFHKDLKIHNNCFGCEWALQTKKPNILLCPYCFFDNINATIDNCLNGYYKKYTCAKRKEKKIEWAKLIRDFPIKINKINN